MKAASLFPPFFAILAVFLLASGSSPSFGRTYKTLTGVPLEATFQELKTSGTQQIVVLKMDRTGRMYEIPLAGLSQADQAHVKMDDIRRRSALSPSSNLENAGAMDSTSGPSLPAPSGDSIFSDLGSKLVSVEGKSVKQHTLAEAPDYYAFYFAASWCHVCHRFTPQLAKYYSNNISYANPKIEFVYVSRDQSKQAMESYMVESGMPWPAIRYSDSTREKLIKKYAPSGTPCLVLVDRAGKVISESFVDGNPRGAFAVKQDIACWFTGGERTEGGIIKSSLTNDKRVSD